jgi:tetratricopeptide (TPR) repeat protein
LGALLFALFYLVAGRVGAFGQAKAPSLPSYSSVTVNDDVQQSLVLIIHDVSKPLLDRQSVVKLYDPRKKVTTWRTSTEKSEASFYDLTGGSYDIDVSAVGYKTQHLQVSIAYAQEGRHVDVFLERDPSAVDLNISDDVIPPKYRKETKRAVYAFKSGHLDEAQKHLDKVYKFAPSSPQLNFLYGYLYLGFKNLDKAESYLSQAAVLDPRRLQTLNLLGRVQLQLQHNRDAQATFEQIIAANPGDWMAHNLLASACLNEKEYEKARQQAQLALDVGKNQASLAQMPLGEALAMLGRDKEAVATLHAFLRENPTHPARADVETFLTKVEEHEMGAAAVIVPHLAANVTDSMPPLPDTPWAPPGVDDAKPPVVTDVKCPYDQVLEKSGARVQQLVEDVSHFLATEYLVHEQLDRFGNPNSKETRKFYYVATIREQSPGYFMVDEDRQLQRGEVTNPDGIITKGFMSLALIFHPDIRSDFQISCEGLSQWQGQAAWLMYFRQRDDKPSRFGKYIVGRQPYDVRLKGRAWITASDFEIVRMESELLRPVDKLSVQHQIVQYGPVHFNSRNVDLWLPKSVDLYLEINRRRYYRQHSFDRYTLFSVDSDQQLPTMKAGPNGTLVKDPDNCSSQTASSTCKVNRSLSR